MDIPAKVNLIIRLNAFLIKLSLDLYWHKIYTSRHSIQRDEINRIFY